MGNIEKTAVTIRNAVRDLPSQFIENEKRIKEIEDEIADIMHLIEFTKFNAYEGYKISRDIQTLRQKRRLLKNENAQLKSIIPILSKWRDRMQNLDKAVDDIQKEKLSQSNRSYRCRVRKDLEDRINGVRK